MAVRIGGILIDLRMGLASLQKDIQQGIKILEQGVIKMSGQLKKLETAFSRVEKVAHSIMKLFMVKMAIDMVIGPVIELTKALSNQANEWFLLQTRIALSSKTMEEYRATSKEISNIAKQTGVALADTVQVFQRLSFSATSLGASTQEILDVTRSVQQLAVVSGASYEAMKYGLLQFGQAISKGVVQAEEWNSIMENIPLVGVKIAESFGMSASDLRNQILKGKVTSKEFFEAFQKQISETDELFKQMPVTLSRGVNQMKISFQELMGQIDMAVGGTIILGKEFKDLAELMDKSVGFFKVMTMALIQTVAQFVRQGKVVLAGFEIVSSTIVMTITGVIASAIDMIYEFLKTATKAFNWILEGKDRLAGALNLPGGMLKTPKLAAPDITPVKNWVETFWTILSKSQNKNAQEIMENLGKIATQAKAYTDTSGMLKPLLGGAITTGGANPAGDGKGGKGKSGGGGSDSLPWWYEKVGRDFKVGENLIDFAGAFEKGIDSANKKLQEFNRAVESLKGPDQVAIERFDEMYTLFEESFHPDKVDLMNKAVEELGKTLSDEFLGEVMPGFKELNDEMNTMKDQLGELKTKGKDSMQEITNAIRAMGSKFEDTFIAMARTGKFAFKEMVGSILEDIARLVLRLTVIEPIVGAITGFITGGKSVAKKASGGWAAAGVPTLVGERGPELVSFGSRAYVTPNDQLGGGGSPSMNFYFNISAIDVKDFRERIAQEAPMIGRMAVSATQQAYNRRGQPGPMDSRRR